MKSRVIALFGILALAFVSAPAFAATNVTMCTPLGSVAPTQVQTFTNGTLTTDSQGCLVIDTSKDTLARDMMFLLRQGFRQLYKVYTKGSTNAVVSNSVVTYFPIGASGTGNVAATIGDASVIAPGVLKIKNLTCATYTILGALTVAGGTSYTFALNQNGTDSALTCTELAAASSCTDTTHTITTAALDQLEFSATPAGSPTALVTKCTAEIDY